MAFQAKTNKSTQLIDIGGDNVVLQPGTAITVIGENGAFGTVCVTVNGQQKCGAMLRADYDAI